MHDLYFLFSIAQRVLLISTVSVIPQIVYDLTICEGDSIYIEELDSTFYPPVFGEYEFEWNGCSAGILFSIDFEFVQNLIFWTSFCGPGGCFDIADTTYCFQNDSSFSHPFGSCGSVYEIEVVVNDSIPVDSFIFYSCPGDCILFNGGTFCNDFSNTTTIPNSSGCDSTVYFEANFYEGSPDPVQLGICEGECITWEGVEYCDAFSQIDSFNTINGCDSIVEFIVQEIAIVPQFLPADTMINLGDELTFEIELNNFEVFWNTGVDSSIFVFNADDFGEGIFPVFATIVNIQTGCLRLTDTTMVQVGEIISTANFDELSKLKIYPNPISANGELHFEFPTEFKNESLKVRLLDQLGQEVFNQSLDSVSDKIVLEKQGGLFSGVYFLEISIGALSTVQRIVVF